VTCNLRRPRALSQDAEIDKVRLPADGVNMNLRNQNTYKHQNQQTWKRRLKKTPLIALTLAAIQFSVYAQKPKANEPKTLAVHVTPLKVSVASVAVATKFQVYVGGGANISVPETLQSPLGGDGGIPAISMSRGSTFLAGEVDSGDAKTKLIKLQLVIDNPTEKTRMFKIGDLSLLLAGARLNDFVAVGYKDRLCAMSEADRRIVKQIVVEVPPKAQRTVSYIFPLLNPDAKQGAIVLQHSLPVTFQINAASSNSAAGYSQKPRINSTPTKQFGTLMESRKSRESNENQPISASAVPATRLEAAIKRIDAVTNVYELKGHTFACIVATREADENAIIGILNGGDYFKATATNWRPLSAEEASKLPKDIREALTSLPKNPLVWLVDVDSLRDPAFDTQYQSLLNNALRALFGTLSGPVIVTLYPPATRRDNIMTNGSIDPSKLAYASLNYSVLSGAQSPSIANSPATVASELIEELTNPNPNVRVSAADALGQSGDGHGNDPRVVEALIATLNDADANVRTSAAQALGKYGDKDPRVIEALIAAMNDDPDANVRVSAVDALGQSGGETGNDPRVVEALIAALNDKALRDGDANVQNSADQALRNYGIATLKDPDANVRVYAAYALGQSGDGHGNDPRVVEALIAALEDTDANVRNSAAQASGNYGDRDPRAVEALIAALKDTDANVRNSAAQALWNYGDRDPRAVEPLIAALKDPDANVRDSAVKALRHYGARDPSASESLIAALQNSDATVQGDAAWALGMISRDPSAVESLNAALKDSDAGVRGDAAWALGLFKDPSGVELLIAALKDSDAGAQCGVPSGFEPRVNICADDSLVEIGAPAVEPLVAALNGSDSLTREGAAMALGEIGNETEGDHCVEPLIAALNDPDAGVRRVAAWALVRAAMTTGTGALIRHDAVNALLDAMRKRELAVIAGASRFFIERGEPGSEEVLIQALNTQGNAWVAEGFLNCGNEALEAAAKKWVSGHGYGITYVGVGKVATWGSGHRRK